MRVLAAPLCVARTHRRAPPAAPTAAACLCRHSTESEMVYEKLPKDVASRFVLLMDPVLGTGNTACKAIQVGRADGCRCRPRVHMPGCQVECSARMHACTAPWVIASLRFNSGGGGCEKGTARHIGLPPIVAARRGREHAPHARYQLWHSSVPYAASAMLR